MYDQKRGQKADNDERNVLSMSLSSTMTGGLDIGDLSSMWNRQEGSQEVDKTIANEIQEKYKKNKWLEFLDEDLEEEFVEKYFYGAIKTHRAFCLIVAGILGLFILLSVASNYYGPSFVMHWVLGVMALIIYFVTKLKNFRNFHFKAMIFIVIYEMFNLGIQRQVGNFEDDFPNAMQRNDAKSFMIVYVFGEISVFLSLRFTFKTATYLAGAIDVLFFGHIAFFKNMHPIDFLENFIFLAMITSVIATASYANEERHRNQEVGRAGILRHTEEIAKEKIITEKLLLNILPIKIARRLMDSDDIIADGYQSATVLFADLVGWTDISHSMSPVEAIKLLNDIVSTFDRLTFMYKIEKIKTIGDAYLVACGLPEPMAPEESSKVMGLFALDVLRALEALSETKKIPLKITIGMHTGPVVAGVIGKTKFLYDLWGDSVNTASRMQSHGDTNRIHVTSTVYDMLQNQFLFEKRPIINVKGKGEMQTYYLLDKKEGVSYHLLHNAPAQEVKEGQDKVADGNQENEDDGKPKESRRKRKAREAILKKSQELEEELDAQIKSSFGVWSFKDSDLETRFRQFQSFLVEERMTMITAFLIITELIIGLDAYRYEAEDVDLYYKVMGVIVSIQFVNAIVCHFSKKDSLSLNLVNFWLTHIGLLIVFGFYRSRIHQTVRFSFMSMILYIVVTFLGSRIPYRYTKHIVGWSWLLFQLIQFFINGNLGYDTTSALMYGSICYYSYATAKFMEKHARREFLLSNLADLERSRVTRQREESERLLYNILPETVIRKMRESDGRLIDTYANASVMFADIVGFTVLSSKLDAKSIVTMLNSLFSQVDEAAERKGLEKIKTIGDAYMVVAGLPYPRPDHAQIAVELALEMVSIVQALPDIEGLKVNVRIGVHSGDVVGGIIGSSKMVILFFPKAYRQRPQTVHKKKKKTVEGSTDFHFRHTSFASIYSSLLPLTKRGKCNNI
eukprot:TRINITY_DN839_c0_g1_i5.p1 TRINITY_DN839_c0_g1~~TRINITY_DN839_c0_g1_i5.p1  ORF type:complete len:963 (+),score=213.17 TRINITY_DN839_c0_g1_i5:117-3005(+)